MPIRDGAGPQSVESKAVRILIAQNMVKKNHIFIQLSG
jgi:hypothetical protein